MIPASILRLMGPCAPLAILLSACASNPHRGGSRLDGAFIQYQSWMTNLGSKAWQQELDAMRQAGMHIVILQQLQHGDTRFIPGAATAPDPTEIILSYADSHQMQVFLGLAVDSGWWRCRQWNSYLETAAAKNMALATEIWQRYGSHPAFAGWYLPQEMWEGPFTDEQVGQARRFFRRLSDHCRSLSGARPKPVAISPFHNTRVTPRQFEQLYRDFLRGAGIDILMLQDGVGAKGWDNQIEEKVVPYFAAMRRACQANRVDCWANVECFQLVGRTPSGAKALAPAEADRLHRQLAAVAPFVQRSVTFDFFHYMSPCRPDARAGKLYEGYLRPGDFSADSGRVMNR